MKALAILAQDINRLTVGWVEDGGLVRETEFASGPESCLSSIDRFLKEQGRSIDEAEAVLVVNGPGAFTAIRASTTLANAIAFARSIPVHTAENPTRLPLRELVAAGAFRPGNGYAVPVYDRPPHITLPKRV
ncbi:hypothetical protein A2856_03330 [Candidatus Uhrbacteria bacterium RIFCSPHIGHO2_01_FULL_63_20]|uniref:Gcp-like domain-containing protein n=1 Tax=Candidatus Uhrbacteria bacterium RIFCSPHIGHO2_01_FULL_63_20 TaxID=1802385 RepID=A0A1F7TLC1_9BACT|nr:MAG: hypothetical protein A2856_03330 [Candidatus Uhrbacteria bacterium RIFCSPHIGHO2_01_FULL_63_20]